MVVLERLFPWLSMFHMVKAHPPARAFIYKIGRSVVKRKPNCRLFTHWVACRQPHGHTGYSAGYKRGKQVSLSLSLTWTPKQQDVRHVALLRHRRSNSLWRTDACLPVAVSRDCWKYYTDAAVVQTCAAFSQGRNLCILYIVCHCLIRCQISGESL